MARPRHPVRGRRIALDRMRFPSPVRERGRGEPKSLREASAPTRGLLHVEIDMDAARQIMDARIAAGEVHDEFVGTAITRGGSIADDRHAGIVADSGDAVLRRLRDAEPM